MKQIIPFKKEITFKTMISKITSISLEHTLEVKENDTVVGDFIVSGSYKMTEASQIDEEFSYKVPIEIAIDTKYDTKDLTIDIDDFVYEIIDFEKLLLKIELCLDKLELKISPVEEEDIISSYDEYEELDNTLQEIEESLNEEQLQRNDDKENPDLFLDNSTYEKLEIPINVNSINSNDISMPEILPYYPKNSSNEYNNTNAIENKMDNTKDNITSIFSAFKDTDETFSTYSIYIIREGDTLETVINKYKTTRDLLAEYNDLSEVRIGSKIIVPNISE